VSSRSKSQATRSTVGAGKQRRRLSGRLEIEEQLLRELPHRQIARLFGTLENAFSTREHFGVG
jgi:hypothetical protein